MKGLSGAVTALILVIASVVIALIVVGFAFGLFGAVSKQGAITPAGPENLFVSNATLVLDLSNTGSNVTVTSITINGQPVAVQSETYYSGGTAITASEAFVPPGAAQTIYIVLNSNSLPAYLQKDVGNTVTVDLYLANGQVVDLTVTVQS